VEGISENGEEVSRRRNIVSETTNRDGVTTQLNILPLSKESNEEETVELSVKKLREEVEVGDQSSVKHDGNVGGIEKLNRVSSGVSSNVLFLDVKIDSETLEVDDDQEDKDSGKEIVNIGETRSIESLLEGSDLVGSGDQKVEKSNDGTFVFSSLFSLNGDG